MVPAGITTSPKYCADCLHRLLRRVSHPLLFGWRQFEAGSNRVLLFPVISREIFVMTYLHSV